MKRRRLRLLVCASAAAASLGGGVLTQAAGPRELLSRMWEERPRASDVSESRLNPRTWFGDEDEQENATAGKGQKETDNSVRRRIVRPSGSSSRADLDRNPFENEPSPVAVSNAGTAAPNVSQGPAAVKQPAPSASAQAPARSVTPDSAGNVTARTDADQQPARKVIVRPQPRTRDAGTPPSSDSPAPLLPDLSGGRRGESLTDSTPLTPAARSQTAPALVDSAQETPPPPASGEERFADEFDSEFQRLVDNVVGETGRQSSATASTAASAAPMPNGGASRVPQRPAASGATDGSGRGSLQDLIAETRRELEQSALPNADPLDGRQLPELPDYDAESDMVLLPDPARAGLADNVTQPVQEFAPERSVSMTRSGSFAPRQELLSDHQSDQSLQAQSRRQPMSAPDPHLSQTGGIARDGGVSGAAAQMTHSDRNPQDIRHADRSDLQGGTTILIVPGIAGSGVVMESLEGSAARPRARARSNGAPAYSVPDNSDYRRLSFDASAGMSAGAGIDSQVIPVATVPGTGSGFPRMAGATVPANPDPHPATVSAIGAEHSSAGMLMLPSQHTVPPAPPVTGKSPVRLLVPASVTDPSVLERRAGTAQPLASGSPDMLLAPPPPEASSPAPDLSAFSFPTDEELAGLDTGSGGIPWKNCLIVALIAAGSLLLVTRRTRVSHIFRAS